MKRFIDLTSAFSAKYRNATDDPQIFCGLNFVRVCLICTHSARHESRQGHSRRRRHVPIGSPLREHFRRDQLRSAQSSKRALQQSRNFKPAGFIKKPRATF
jgi:hypothetical protein